MFIPDHKVKAIQALTKVPKNKDEKALWEYYKSGVIPKDTQLMNSINKYEDEISNYILQSFLLAEIEIDKISKYLGITKACINYFKEYFFDTNLFIDKLSKISYFFSIMNREDKPIPYILAWLKLAVYTQKEYFETIFLNPSEIDIDILIRRVLIDTFIASVGIDGDTKGTNSQIRFIDTLIKSADLLKKYKSDGIKDPLKSIQFLIETNKRDIKVEVNTEDLVT